MIKSLVSENFREVIESSIAHVDNGNKIALLYIAYCSQKN